MDRPALSGAARSLRRGRWAQALVYAAIGAALLATAFRSWIDVQGARTVVTASQGRRLLLAVGRDLEGERPLTREGLDAALRQHRDEGLRCLAVVRRDGEPPLATGDCPRPPAELQERLAAAVPGAVIDLDGLVAVATDPPPPLGHPPPPPGSEPPGPDAHGGPPPWGPPPGLGPRGPGDQRDGPPREFPPPGPGGPPPHERLLIVYEPIEANALRQSAARSLGVAPVTVLALAIATIVLWRLARRAEQLQAAAERDRRLVTLGEMSAVLAHEIRNPLAALKGHAQLLVERLDRPGAERDKAERLVSETRRLERSATVGRDGERLAFVIRDHGTGLPADEAERLFEPFHTTRVQGTGLGLAVARRIVELHGGRVTACTHRDGGAEFRIVIP